MIKLSYKLENQKFLDIKERIDSLSLAYELKKDKSLKKISLKDGDTIFEGEKSINDHIDKLEIELRKWWYCDC